MSANLAMVGFQKRKRPDHDLKPAKDLETVTADGQSVNARAFRKVLITWGRKHFRRFPWRQTSNPYHILLAEILLHRTQAKQVAPVYKFLVEQYPTVKALASAKKEELYDILRPLGLRWRIELLYRMVQELVFFFHGKIPHSKSELLSLSGVSDYIAGAVRCFAWNLPEPLIDTNTVRVIGRVFGLKIKDSSRRNTQFKHLIASLVDPDEARAYNYAMLDLADRICTKKQPPDCKRCPILRWCAFGTSQR